ncbi:hypothetical protein OAN307_c48630 [Octadecabacter antarcticus 307]|uniref:Uncharacterized protein n=1 Tax=Octadecabacter antarcticus 307 TaxID=391626 RepID=M9RK41_9RHOB|nr:DUF6165 family protein [Octadecabacter antarcticus]AGI70205.1 hypothetical protein OAN307_c48630 [Octadecabacter antarcticus 307]
MTEHILVPTAPGELIDKLTILRLKEERMIDPAKVVNVQIEMAALTKTAASQIPTSVELTALWAELYAINGDLWVIEDDIRDCEKAKDFGENFIRLARAVYITNDSRADVKNKINLLLGSTLIEEKSYADHGVET